MVKAGESKTRILPSPRVFDFQFVTNSSGSLPSLAFARNALKIKSVFAFAKAKRQKTKLWGESRGVGLAGRCKGEQK
ncbi:hypothetical protein EII14_04440 [Alloprevotella sp. OH1205_COT-284]|uniref:hypothetical protein n=1 Tax=Alloprevotella sp. OH1205_COT-284 TaxID=2491043 RepID=UPI000F60204D|nr:hypothetical protein [Alloprevotella sp. OH1205_COT-284]RRD80004.1 hypothetical protein EII14_04440 [Alloprevotella sp. OH1205_COT-284]